MTESHLTLPEALSPPSTPLLELRQVSCERDERQLFARLNLQAHPGDVIQILGPNGSGKTTLLRALAGINNDFTGEVLWNGRSLPEVAWEYSQSLLYIGHLPGIKKALSPLENLRWYAAISGTDSRSAIYNALDAVGLYGYEETPCYQLSAGQLRRVALARLYFSQARLWILDEPFTAIDKRGAAQLETRFAQHAQQGGVILLTSHQDLALSSLKHLNLLDYQAISQERGGVSKDACRLNDLAGGQLDD